MRLLLLVVLLAGCAHTEVPPLRGEPQPDGHIALHPVVAPLLDDADRDVWAPSIAYPTLPPPHPHRAKMKTVHMTADGPLQATGWLAFQTYQGTLSRLNGSTCRFHPTCSGFGLQAVREHRLLGVPLTFARLQRGHHDPAYYGMTTPPFLDDPVANYQFTSRRPRLDDVGSYANPAHGWYQHVRATRRLEPLQ